jgi:hypothetical protein
MPASSAPATRSRRLTVIAAVVLVFAAFCFTPAGEWSVAVCHRFLDFYAGVFSLVALSLTVMGGLAATDRLILLIRHRVLLQAIHRALAAAAMGFLVVHIAMKIVGRHAGLLDTVVPFLADHRAGYVGLGTIAAYLMAIAAWTGISRGRFAEMAHPGLWRLLHGSAYAAWPVALVHGLFSGRPAATWVTVSYSVCLIAVGLAIGVRLSVHWGRWRATAESTTGSPPRIGARVPTAVPLKNTDPGSNPGPSRVAPVSPAIVTTASLAGADEPFDRRAYAGRHSGAAPRSSQSRATEAVVPAPRRQRRRAADTAPPAAPTFESVSDDEFWAFMRGERR